MKDPLQVKETPVKYYDKYMYMYMYTLLLKRRCAWLEYRNRSLKSRLR